MRLTATIRNAFVHAAMDDVPSVDYREKIRSLVTEAAIASLPPKVRAVWDDPDLRAYLAHDYNYYGDHHKAVYIGVGTPTLGGWKPPEAVSLEINRVGQLEKDQAARRDALHQKLQGVANSVTTRAALLAALPEFEKYLPDASAPASRQLPAIANLVADFVQAGWPKKETA